jgi:opacity protein-like surface antigen
MLKKLVLALVLAALVLVPAAFADAVFHSTHARLSPVGGGRYGVDSWRSSIWTARPTSRTTTTC